jgi:hypothetical protein
MQKPEKIEEVTAAQDDGFVGGLSTTGSICRKHEKIENSQPLRMTALSGP